MYIIVKFHFPLIVLNNCCHGNYESSVWRSLIFNKLMRGSVSDYSGKGFQLC